MGDVRTDEERALVRAAAEDIVCRQSATGPHREYRQMGRGTLAALDWVEGRRDVTPSTDVVAGPDDVIVTEYRREVQALGWEIVVTEGWGSGHERVPREDMHYHGAVWALLRWWARPSSRMHLAITVDGLDV